MSISNNSTGLRPGVCLSTTRPTTPYAGQHIFETDTGKQLVWDGSSWSSNFQTLSVALSDEYTPLTTGTGKVIIRAPFGMKLFQIPRASLTTASSSGLPTVNIRVSGTTIFSTQLSIDATEKTSVTAATPAVLSTTTIADDAEIIFDIVTAGTNATGLKVTLYYRIT